MVHAPTPLAQAYTLTQALARFSGCPAPAAPRRALDLGCGAGTDTLALLRHGWQVTALDRNPAAVAAVQQAAAAARLTELTALTTDFEEVVGFPACFLVNATFALPFCRPAGFPALWQRLTAALESGGRFAGQFFGPHDSWAADPALTILSQAQVLELLAPDYELEILLEQEKDGTAYNGRPKHWHVLHVVARRR